MREEVECYEHLKDRRLEVAHEVETETKQTGEVLAAVQQHNYTGPHHLPRKEQLCVEYGRDPLLDAEHSVKD